MSSVLINVNIAWELLPAFAKYYCRKERLTAGFVLFCWKECTATVTDLKQNMIDREPEPALIAAISFILEEP